MVIAGLQAAEHNSLGVFFPDRSEYRMSAVPWKATKQEIDFQVKVALMKEKKFPTGDWVYVISELFNLQLDGVVEQDFTGMLAAV